MTVKPTLQHIAIFKNVLFPSNVWTIIQNLSMTTDLLPATQAYK